MTDSSINSNKRGTAEFLDVKGLTTLLEETNTSLTGFGIDLEKSDAMTRIYSDEQTTNTYIDSLSEGLSPEDIPIFKQLSVNMIDCMMGRGNFQNRGMMNVLTEDNISAGFMPKAKVLFPSATCF